MARDFKPQCPVTIMASVRCTLEEGHGPFTWPENGEVTNHAYDYQHGPYAPQYMEWVYRKDTNPEEFE